MCDENEIIYSEKKITYTRCSMCAEYNKLDFETYS